MHIRELRIGRHPFRDTALEVRLQILGKLFINSQHCSKIGNIGSDLFGMYYYFVSLLFSNELIFYLLLPDGMK